MRVKTLRFSLILFIITTIVFLSNCRQVDKNKAEKLAETLGHQEAFYLQEKEAKGLPSLSLDINQISRPANIYEFIRHDCLPPVEQGNTGTCWSFAATSLLESELRRMGRPMVKLSEMFTVYWEYVEKARRFIREKGNSFLGQGSEPDLALERIKQYGIVRHSDYAGLATGLKSHDHSRLFKEYTDYLQSLKLKASWDEKRALDGVRAILDKHLGPPPEQIVVDGISMSPLDFLNKILGLNPSDYKSFISFLYLPFYAQGEFKVPDNWARKSNYYNLPLHEFYIMLLRALRRGYTATLSVDFTEPGYRGDADMAIIPTFDIPRNFIDQFSRELRFVNQTTTDDHAVHCIGYKEDLPGETWFLVKDSWENAFIGTNKGYFFYRDDYLKLKCLMFMVHKDAIKEIMGKFPGVNEDKEN